MEITKVRMLNFDGSQEIEFVQFDKLALLVDYETVASHVEYKFDNYTTSFGEYATLKEHCLSMKYSLLFENTLTVSSKDFNELRFTAYSSRIFNVFQFDGFIAIIDGATIQFKEYLDNAPEEIKRLCNASSGTSDETIMKERYRVDICNDTAGRLALRANEFHMGLVDLVRAPGEYIEGDDVEERLKDISEYRIKLMNKGVDADEDFIEAFDQFFENYSEDIQLTSDSDIKELYKLKDLSRQLAGEVIELYESI
ncbi:hypothetical protein LJB89_00490 [Tyzzerella sp. OttesenSCG-928-J15]|nr:hypothetical protein [Tyzzerella sp. OttesenSCG-928-J15]